MTPPKTPPLHRLDSAQSGSAKPYSPLTSPSPPPPLLTADDMAVLLRVHRKTVYRMASKGQIPGKVNVGGRLLRFHRDTVLEWIGRASSLTSQEME